MYCLYVVCVQWDRGTLGQATICQRLPVDFEEKLTGFRRYVSGLRHRHSYYCFSQIRNSHQTPIYFDMPLTRTVEAVGAKQVKVRTTGNEKQRVTIMLACTTDGKRLPPYITISRKTLLKSGVFPHGAIIRCNDKGWITAELFNEWILLVWLHRPGAVVRGPCWSWTPLDVTFAILPRCYWQTSATWWSFQEQ